MTQTGYLPYEPQLDPVECSPGVWTIEGPTVTFRALGVPIPCPTRMTVIRLPDDTLWLHSPVEFSPTLAASLDDLGPVSCLVAPNTMHGTHVSSWASAYPLAKTYSVTDSPWTGAIAAEWWDRPEWATMLDWRLIDLGKFKEAVFFHRPTCTLIVTDMMHRFEADRVESILARWLLRVAGALGPNPRPSIEIRLAARGREKDLRSAVAMMLAWAPSSIILSHGPCIRHDAIAAIEQAFTWVSSD